MPTRTRLVPVLAVLAVVASVAPAAIAEVPFPADRGGTSATGVYDYPGYLYIDDGSCEDGQGSHGGRDLPSNFDCDDDWKYTDHRERLDEPPDDETWDPAAAANPQEFYGVKGTGLNRAWEVSTGRPDVVIAVLDSGIRWEEDRPSLLRKHHINRGELPRPHDAAGNERHNPTDTVFDGYDVDGDLDADGAPDGQPDGVFNVADYWEDDRVDDLNANGSIDPEDLIRTFSDGLDDDGNGYVDDISGWDFFEDDNNPQDDVDYGHGTGEADDSGGEAGFSDGQCPNCMVMTMRVGDSFIADVNHFADAVVYAVDNGASVVQEALGTLNHTSYGQAALDHAYRNGVIVNASEADEAAGHHNWPAAYDHTMVVNSIRIPSLPTTRPYSHLYFNGCTNFGGYTFVSIPSTACSSEATGRSAGVSGLLYSAARNAIDRDSMTPYLDDDGQPTAFPLSAEEAMQLWRLSADDIDFSSPCPEHPFCDDAPDDVLTPTATANNYGTTTPDTTRYQTVQGWDYFTGYGRNNAARLLHFIGRDTDDGTGERVYAPASAHDPYAFGSDGPDLEAQDRIPPEADITWPRWWHQYAVREDGTLLLPDDPAAPDQVVIHGRVAANRVTAAGGTFDWVLEYAPHVQGVKFPQSQDPGVEPSSSEERSTGPWTPIAEGEALTAAYEGELGRVSATELADALDPTLNPFDPLTDPTSRYQPERNAIRLRVRVIADPIDEHDDVNNEAVFQKQIDVYPAEELVVRDDLGEPIGDPDDPGIADMDRLNVDGLGRYAGGAPSPSYHDLDGDGVDEVLIASSDGVVHAFTDLATGQELPGWPVTVDPYAGVADHLVGDGETLVDNAYTRGEVTTDVHGSILLGTLAAADLDDDGRLEVLAADLEGRLYAWDPDGTRRPGFPVSVDRSLSQETTCEGRGLAAGGDALCDDYESGTGATPDGSVHGDAPPKRDRWNARDWGINSAPAIGDLDGDPRNGLEIVVGSNDAHVYAWHADGTPVDGWPVVLRDPDKVAEMDPDTRFWTYTEDANAAIGTKILVSPALGDIDDDGDLEVVIGVNEEYVESPNVSADQPVPTALEAAGVDPGNTRVYALHHDGTEHAHHSGSEATPHVHDQAYVEGWPVPIAMLVTNLLPYVAAGPNTQAVLYDADGDGDLEIAVGSAAGPGYVLEHDGSSYLGEDANGYRTLASTGGVTNDQPTFVAVGALAAGSLDGGGHHTLAGPGAGLIRLLDVLVEGQQQGAEDHLQLWNGTLPTGDYEPNAPIVVNDLQFFTPPTIGDLTGDGLAEVVQSTAMSDTVALGLAPPHQNEATALRHFTGGWTVASAAIGDGPMGIADDGNLELAAVTREGYLRAWPTDVEGGGPGACTAQAEWPEYGHDAANSGNYLTDAERPYPVTELESSDPDDDGRVTLTFGATGDDRACGSAGRYELRRIPGRVDDPRWDDPRAVDHPFEADDPPAAGESDELQAAPLPPGEHTLLLRAYDDAGNGSAVTSVVAGSVPDDPRIPGPGPDNRSPVADAGPGKRAIAGEPTTLRGSATDPDGDEVTFRWDLGDGTTVDDDPVRHTYRTRGVRTATLTVTDEHGASGTDTTRIQTVEVRRVWGTERIATAIEIAHERYDRSDLVVLARTDDYADALAGAPWAASRDAPILLNPRSGLHPDVREALRELDTTRVRLLGGEAALSEQVRRDLEAIGMEVRRFAGVDRYDTARLIARELDGAHVFVAEGDDPSAFRGWPDAMVSAPLAAHLEHPILLVVTDATPDTTRRALREVAAEEATIVGGRVAVSEDVERELRELGLEIDRAAGGDRYGTSGLVAQRAAEAGMDPAGTWLARGDNWPDSLTSGPVVGANGDVLLLVHPEDLASSSATRDRLRSTLDELSIVRLLGGDAAIGPAVEEDVKGLIRSS